MMIGVTELGVGSGVELGSKPEALEDLSECGGRPGYDGPAAYLAYAAGGQNQAPPRWPGLVREMAVEEASVGASVGAAVEGVGSNAPRTPEPGTDPDDELFLLGEECAEAYMKADALQYQAMRLLAEFDRRDGWKDTGFSSTPEWLAWRIGIKIGPARERLRTAKVLVELPETSEAMRQGELSFTKVRALTRIASPENESTLLAFARAGSAANLERLVRGWKLLDRKSEITAEQIRHRSRRFSAYVEDDGMVVVRGRLDPEVGAQLMRAIEAASDALFREEGRSVIDEPDTELQEITPEQRRADALGLLAERALAAGFGERARPGGDVSAETPGAPAAEGGPSGEAPISGSRADRYQVLLHVEENTLKEEGEVGLSELEDGTRVSAETSRRLACDASMVKITTDSRGRVVGAGRRKRTVSPSLRRALEARDRGCRFPGCGLRFTEAHHVRHWADGGETTLRNLVLLCRTHHRAVHEGSVRVCIDRTGQVVFFTPKGRALFEAPMVRTSLTRAEKAAAWQLPGPPMDQRTGVRSGASEWKRDADIPSTVGTQAFMALEAVESTENLGSS